VKASDRPHAAPPRLVTESSAVGTLVREACAYRPPFDQAAAFERVRKRASARAPFRLHGVSFAFAAFAVALAGFALFAYARSSARDAAPVADRASPVPVVREQPLPAGETKLDDGTRVRVEASAAARLESNEAVTRVALERGTVTLDVARKRAGQTLEVATRSHRFVVRGTSFSVSASEADVTLAVREGRVAVFRATELVAEIGAGERWTAASGRISKPGATLEPQAPERSVAPHATPSSRAVEKDDAARSADDRDCLALARARRARDAEQCFVSQARGTALGAELALFELSRLRADVLGDPAGALAALREHRTRFPNGSLRAEADISTVHLLARLGRSAELLSETAKLLESATGRERAAELRMLRGNTLRGMNDCRRADPEYAEVERAGGKFAADAGYFRGVCFEALGNREGAANAYRRYLQTSGRPHQAEARRRLDSLEP
jgi:ferric-dicitrate binding protein FerR (iron transport regulator)